tara:strand:- start:79 stop:258 length:180 start_codon:yes stop_codon:yes gene_type:complete
VEVEVEVHILLVLVVLVVEALVELRLGPWLQQMVLQIQEVVVVVQIMMLTLVHQAVQVL